MEFGIFEDGYCCERDFATRAEAEAALAKRYSREGDLHVAEVCRDHPDHERDGCEPCALGEDPA